MAGPTKSDAETITRRTAFLGVGAVGVFGVLSSRLFYLQVVKAEDYRMLSEDNRFNFNVTLPRRGEIRDRFGERLAINRQDYRVELIPERTKDVKASLDKVGEIIPLSSRERRRILKDVKENSRFVPVLIKDHLDWSVFSALNIRMHNLAGIIPKVGSARAYPNDGLFSHTLGFVGRAGKADVDKDSDPLLRQPTFRIGKTGVEAAMESELRGSSGRLKVEVNARGRIVREWPDPKTQAIAGNDVHITLDAELQRFAAKQFIDPVDGETDSGGIAVIDVITGELRTLLSMPTFDGNLFVSGLTQTDMNRMNNDPKRPQFNKVLGGGYPPASTYKMVVMLAALESGLISPYRQVFCLGKVRLGNRNFHCWKRRGHGHMNMRDALKNSCDSYFYEIAQVIGIQKIADMARRLGLGQTYDIGISGQRGGIVPDPAWKQDRLGAAWREGDTLNTSIGQGFTLTTPLQLAVMSARLANAQQAVTPSLLIGGEVKEFAALDINPENLAFVRDAMYGVCNEPGGTAYRYNGLGIKGVDLAGKTGTGQVRGISASERSAGVRKNNRLPWKLRDHSIFVGFAPYDKPRFAIGTIVEHGGSGAKRAANITRAVMGEALRRDGIGAPAKNEAEIDASQTQ